MKLHLRLLVLLPIFFLVFVFTPLVFADAKSDFDYQYGQYRINFAEFAVLKQDYLATPSLDNQQKAMISAKQTILARDLAKASMNWYLMDLIAGYKISYEPIVPIINVLASSRQYFLDQAQKSTTIITQDDLKKFTDRYVAAVQEKDSFAKFGIVAAKIANLVRIQIDSITALDSLVPKLPSPMPVNLEARVQELRAGAKAIDAKIELLARGMDLADAVGQSANEIFFTSRVENLIEIRNLQLNWINQLIDIDINYAQPQI